jgi:hypothetical protein
MNENVQALMQEIATELKKGVRGDQAKLERLNKRLDRALGTELKPEDSARARAWERSRR